MRRAVKVLTGVAVVAVLFAVAGLIWIRSDLVRINRDLAASERSPLPRRVIDAIVAVEDPNFAKLSSQFVRSYLTRRGVADLARELILDAVVDLRSHPEQIAQAYAQTVYFGTVDGRPIQGVSAAARTYFSVSPDQLTAAQLASLVATIRSPRRFSPRVTSAQAGAWRLEVLSRMRSAHVITSADYQTAAQALGKR